MGRKSNEKKKRHEQEIKKGKNKSILEFFLRKKSEKKTQAKKEKTPSKPTAGKGEGINKRKILSGAFVIIMIAILLSTGYLLFQKAFKASPLAKILPADSTIAILEINTNFDHNQTSKTLNLLSKYPEYSKEKLLEKIEEKFVVDYSSDLKSWLGRQIGTAIVNSKKDEGHINTLFFAEIANKKEALDFLKRQNSSTNTYNGYETYMINGPKYLTFLGNYLVISDADQAIYELIDEQKNGNDKLYGTADYRKINNNLPLNKEAFLYINFDQIRDSVFQYFSFLGEKGLSMENLGPFLKLFDAEGIALVAMDDNFAIQSFLSLDDDLAKNIEYMSFPAKYNANLANYVLNDTLAFFGGSNLEAQLKRILGILAGGSESSLIVFDNIINSYAQKYFGPDTNFNRDILPLFNKEFAVAIENYENGHSYKLLIELDSPQADSIKLHELASNFASIGAIFEPKIVDYTLPDGTISKEIIAIPEEIVKSESEYKKNTIFELKLGKQNWGIYYAMLDKVAVIATSSDGVKSAIDAGDREKISLRSTNIFSKHIAPVLKSSDEVSYFNIEKLLPVLFKDKNIPGFVKIIASLSSGRNYFNDGIITINYIHIK